MLSEEELMKAYLEMPYLQFEPRPNTETDQMTSFINDDFEGGKIILGGTGSAKSYTTAFLFAQTIFKNKAPLPNTPIWIGSQTHDMVGNIWLQALSRFIPQDMIENIRWRKTGLHPEIVMLKKDEKGNSFNIHFFSYEQGRRALQSTNVWAVWLDEQCSSDIIEEVWGRLRTWKHPNMLIYSLTPLDPDKFLEELYERRDEPEIAGLWRFYHLDTMKNPHITDEWKKNYLDSLPPDVRLTRQFGLFASYKGAVYPEFTNDLCQPIKKKEQLNGNQYLAIDFGFHHPAAMWIIEENGTYYVVNDFQGHDIMPDKLANTILERGWDYRWKTFADYEDTISVRYLNAAGITTSAARKNVLDGINNLKTLMYNKRFYVYPDCRETIKQLKSYQWKVYAEDKEQKDEVKKVNDHLADCARYITYTTLKSKVNPWNATVGGSAAYKLIKPMHNPLIPSRR